MLFGNLALPSNFAGLTPAEYDPTNSTGSIGAISLRRPKKSGRNPATGARNSRKYGISMLFLTGFPPMTDSYGNQI